MTDRAHDPRLDAVLEVLLRFARRDFSARMPVSDELDVVDAIATGLNMMAEELDGEVASQRELADAYRTLQATQVKLVHAAKLASIGQLASGVAHEVNNPAGWSFLALVLAQKRVAEVRRAVEGGTHADLAVDLAPALDELETVLKSAVEGVERIRAIVGDLRTFARSAGDETEIVVLDDVVRATCHLMAPSMPTGVELDVATGDVPAVRGNRGRLGQVVANLVVNASRAIERARGEGLVRVRTESHGTEVCLTVEDDGPGVPLDLRERVFDPFFTTDPSGTGLGLSLVAEIVARHGGHVRIGSGELGGARFEVLLPRATEATSV